MPEATRKKSVKRVVVLGATGSLGGSFLSAIARIPMRVVGLSCRANKEKLQELTKAFSVDEAVLVSESAPEAQERMIASLKPDLVVNAIAGIEGLGPAVTALSEGIDLVMGCKEALVAAGPLLMKLAEKTGARLIPADSEHVAARELLGQTHEGISELILTGTGGPLRDLPPDQRELATLDQVMTHPVWKMGKKITVDSATLVNKAMEVIEAAWLFNLPHQRLRTGLHKQGTIHAAIITESGQVMAHIAKASMQELAFHLLTDTPWGKVVSGQEARKLVSNLQPPEPDSCALLGHQAIIKNAASFFTGADHAVTEAFLAGRIDFGSICRILRTVMAQCPIMNPAEKLSDIMRDYHYGYKAAAIMVQTQA